MSKQDVPDLPVKVPSKRRQVESLLDVHIAQWLASDDLIPSERKRLEVEKERRKQERRRSGYTLGLIVDEEGVTPEQLDVLRARVQEEGVLRIVHPGVPSSKLHGACKHSTADLEVLHFPRDWYERAREVVKQADVLLLGPKSTYADSSLNVWTVERYARHRKVPTIVVAPSGDIIEGSS
jgi:cellobiose-specific phosphotransferase system component IIB